MSRSPWTFRQRDVARLVKAATAAGLHVSAVRVNPQIGTIEIVTGESVEQDSAARDASVVAAERIDAMRRGAI
jgi:hypothetical protein